MGNEQLANALSGLYRSYGYQSYTMSKFEEYELYLHNKDFLISDRVLTFTDTDGKLMALKPDVTLSIIKNSDDSGSGIQKVFYRENVYRPGNQGFREIMQVGLECMGSVDSYCIFEVLLLAVKSLRAISPRCVLDISHMGLLSRLLDRCCLTGAARKAALDAIGNKNSHELRGICRDAGVSSQELEQLIRLSGSPETVLPDLDKLFSDAPELTQFKELLRALQSAGVDCANVDFSVVNDMNYYNGIVFRGFVEGIPAGVLSGGQYDGLMEKMNRRGKAIGFALYPDLLKRLMPGEQSTDVDAVLYYEEDAALTQLAAAVAKLAEQGLRVSAQPGSACNLRAQKYYRLEGNEVKPVETDA